MYNTVAILIDHSAAAATYMVLILELLVFWQSLTIKHLIQIYSYMHEIVKLCIVVWYMCVLTYSSLATCRASYNSNHTLTISYIYLIGVCILSNLPLKQAQTKIIRDIYSYSYVCYMQMISHISMWCIIGHHINVILTDQWSPLSQPKIPPMLPRNSSRTTSYVVSTWSVSLALVYTIVA